MVSVEMSNVSVQEIRLRNREETYLSQVYSIYELALRNRSTSLTPLPFSEVGIAGIASCRSLG